MPKIPTPSAATAESPKALDVLIDIADQALAFRYADKTLRLTDIGRTVIDASRTLRIRDADERVRVENSAVVALAKKRNLLS